MNKTTQIVLGVLGVGAAVTGAYFLSKKAMADTAGTDGFGSTAGGGGGTTGSGGGVVLGNTGSKQLNTLKILKRGDGWTSLNAEVRMLQLILNNIEKPNRLDDDGKFGPLTESKLIRVTGRNQTTLSTMYVQYYYAIPK